jgi:hypothetical protein
MAKKKLEDNTPEDTTLPSDTQPDTPPEIPPEVIEPTVDPPVETVTEQLHIENVLSPITADKCHAVIRQIESVLPANAHVNIHQCLNNAVIAALEAYQSHTGTPFQL